MINLTINKQAIAATPGTTILEAAKQNHIDIPHLCYIQGVHHYGACRLCVVEVEGINKLQASCMAEVKEGMVVHTDSEVVHKVRKINYELLLSTVQSSLAEEQKKEFNNLGILLGVSKARLTGQQIEGKVNITPHLTIDRSKCILCRRCVTVCNEAPNAGILNAQNRGFKTIIGPAMDQPVHSELCGSCSRCSEVCPTGAIENAHV